jgi:hypothetical protein
MAFTTLVLELVEGPTLADRIADGQLSLDEAMPIARQIAEALAAAHSQGIVHRDLKPANIKCRPDGTVKVLDFGLAKAAIGDMASANVTLSPTMTSPALTQMGIILGTAAYMSPEQVRGKPADKRSDIWAFGAVLYEMLTGKPAFAGDDVSYTLANILKTEPDWNALPAGTPSTIVRALRRCLEKDPNRRTHDISDARIDLEEKDHSVAATVGSTKPRLLTVERVAWVLLASSLAGVVTYIELRTTPPPAVVRFQIGPPEEGSFGSTSGIGRADGTSGAILSPDGTRLAFVATRKNGRSEIWLRRLDSFTSRPLSGTGDVLMPFWSPDSRSIGFFAAGKLKRIDTTDGSVETITDAAGVPRGASWGSRDVIVFSVGTPPILARVSAGGGEVTPIVTPGNTFARWPSFLPDGRHFLYVGRLPTEVNMIGILVGSIEPGFEPRSVVAGDSNASFAAPGVLLFMRGERLMQQRFDLDRLKVSGDATPVVEDVFYNPGVGRADFTSRAVASWHSDPAPIAATSSRGSIVPGSYSKLSVLLAITARRTFLPMASGSPTATSTSETSGSSIWRDTLHRGSRTVRAPRRRRCGFQMAPRSPIGPTSVACSRRMSPAPAPSGFCSPNSERARSDLRGRQMGPVLCRHARRKSGRVRAADCRGAQAATGRADAVSRRRAAILPGRALARVRLERKREKRSLRPGVSVDRTALADLEQRRTSAALARRRQRALLRQR